jgi:hypothetical protein
MILLKKIGKILFEQSYTFILMTKKSFAGNLMDNYLNFLLRSRKLDLISND